MEEERAQSDQGGTATAANPSEGGQGADDADVPMADAAGAATATVKPQRRAEAPDCPDRRGPGTRHGW